MTMKKLHHWLKIVTIVVFAIVFIFIIFLTTATLSPKLDLKNANNVSFYDGKNQLFFEGSGSREWISLSKMSKNIIDATISVEDKNFYRHRGFDYARILKSMFLNMRAMKIVQGASTITQQYARNLYLEFEKNWNRKVEEAWFAFKMEVHYSKDEILEGYLNTINYGNGVLGIENASRYYFDKSASDLTLAEASMLAGIPKSPNYFSPLNDEVAAKNRQRIILDSMVRNHYITKDVADYAYAEKLTYIGKTDNLNLKTLMYYQDAVIKELKSLKEIPDSIMNYGGLKIYTTLDLDAQTILEQSITNNLNDNPSIQTAAVVVKPDSGNIIALAGGRDYSKSQFNRATLSKRQVGSTMKPFLYYSALENGFTSSTTFISEPTTFTLKNSDYSPKNYGNIYPGKPITMTAALAYSDNIYAVKTHVFLGEEMLVDTMDRVGVKNNMKANTSLALGTEEMNIIDFLTGYNTLANEGNYMKLHLINKVENKNGKILYEFKDTKKQVLNPSYVFIINDMLTSTYDLTMVDYTYPTCVSITNLITKKYALKSGSTDYDSWTIGYNNDLLVGVWNGYDFTKTLEKTDSKYSKKIWVSTAEGILKDTKTNWYKIPDNVVGVMVDPINGNIATNSTKKRILYYVKGTEPFIKTQ